MQKLAGRWLDSLNSNAITTSAMLQQCRIELNGGALALMLNTYQFSIAQGSKVYHGNHNRQQKMQCPFWIKAMACEGLPCQTRCQWGSFERQHETSACLLTGLAAGRPCLSNSSLRHLDSSKDWQKANSKGSWNPTIGRSLPFGQPWQQANQRQSGQQPGHSWTKSASYPSCTSLPRWVLRKPWEGDEAANNWRQCCSRPRHCLNLASTKIVIW